MLKFLHPEQIPVETHRAMCAAVPVLDWQCWFPSKTKGPNTVHGLNSWCLDDRVGLKVLSICFFRFQGQTMPRWPAFVASAHCQFVIIKTINWICLVLDTELIANIFSGKIICLWSWTPNSAACQGRVNHLVGSRNQPHCPYRIDGPLPLCRQTLSKPANTSNCLKWWLPQPSA